MQEKWAKDGTNYMHDPLPDFLGIYSSDVIASFGGSLVGLLFTKPMSNQRLALTMFANISCGAWVAPLVVWVLDMPEPLRVCVSFLLGVTAVALLVVVFETLDRIKRDPLLLIRKITGIKNDS